MSRASRIPYHQNVYDLLQIEPGESPDAARMIAEHEAAHGPLPASVREWYLVLNEPRLAGTGWVLDQNTTTIWAEFSGDAYFRTLLDVLEDYAKSPDRNSQPRVLVNGNQRGESYLDAATDCDDPPVWAKWPDENGENSDEWELAADRFSDFVCEWIVHGYRTFPAPGSKAWEIEPDTGTGILAGQRTGYVKRYPNGLWLRVPAETFCAPVIDYLTEQIDEPERTPRPGNVTTYTWRPAGGTIRVTADEPGLGGGLSAWWLHAESPERLADLARLVLPFGTLRETLRADTDVAREVFRAIV